MAAAAETRRAEASMAECEREADALFRQHNVYEIQQHARVLRTDVDKRRQELRAMVGERYRELIQAADSIVAMRAESEKVETLLVEVKDACALPSLRAHAEQVVKANEHATARSPDRDALYCVAAQIKLLVDTPEQIWHALEGQRFLRAGKLYLVARQIHSNLHNRDGAEGNADPSTVRCFAPGSRPLTRP